ncbi:unnamed protein product [Linum tenue]|uniref:Uncharacterized protein n=1 Tax=Linum tenue TaxID=586396 RepID=A0AAV0H4Z6_9ROSI|nr:unnamed protein product [Linum tenue]
MQSSGSTGSCAAGNASAATPRRLASSSTVEWNWWSMDGFLGRACYGDGYVDLRNSSLFLFQVM